MVMMRNDKPQMTKAHAMYVALSNSSLTPREKSKARSQRDEWATPAELTVVEALMTAGPIGDTGVTETVGSGLVTALTGDTVTMPSFLLMCLYKLQTD